MSQRGKHQSKAKNEADRCYLCKIMYPSPRPTGLSKDINAFFMTPPPPPPLPHPLCLCFLSCLLCEEFGLHDEVRQESDMTVWVQIFYSSLLTHAHSFFVSLSCNVYNYTVQLCTFAHVAASPDLCPAIFPSFIKRRRLRRRPDSVCFPSRPLRSVYGFLSVCCSHVSLSSLLA